MPEAIDMGWGERLIRIWNDGWIDLPGKLGGKIAGLIGAGDDEVLVTEATSTNLFKLGVAALRARPGRSKIVSDVFNFPSDLYILQGIIDLLRRTAPSGVDPFPRQCFDFDRGRGSGHR